MFRRRSCHAISLFFINIFCFSLLFVLFIYLFCFYLFIYLFFVDPIRDPVWSDPGFVDAGMLRPSFYFIFLKTMHSLKIIIHSTTVSKHS